MENVEILKQMFLMQQRLNDETNGKNGKKEPHKMANSLIGKDVFIWSALN